jgi:hypothetical protein
MKKSEVTNEQITSVIKALDNLVEIGRAPEGDFYTIAWIEDSTDSMGLTTLTSPHHFKTIEGLARYIVAELIDPSEFSEVKEITDETAEDWVRDYILSEDDTEEPGKYVIFFDCFSD